MKKFISIATIILVAHATQAITFDWGITGGYTFVGGTAIGNRVGGITATLVYLGEGVTSYNIANWEVLNPMAQTSSSGKATSTSQTSTVAALNGKTSTVSFDLAAGEQVGSSASDILTAGSSTFGLFLTYTDSDSVTWYNVSSSTYTIPAGSSDITTGLSTNFSFDWKQNERGVALTSGGGWSAAAVPEPSTAALALAGLALLLKRRKA